MFAAYGIAVKVLGNVALAHIGLSGVEFAADKVLHKDIDLTGRKAMTRKAVAEAEKKFKAEAAQKTASTKPQAPKAAPKAAQKKPQAPRPVAPKAATKAAPRTPVAKAA